MNILNKVSAMLPTNKEAYVNFSESEQPQFANQKRDKRKKPKLSSNAFLHQFTSSNSNLEKIKQQIWASFVL